MPTHDSHDPEAFVAELGQKLASRDRRVSFIFGAGVSRACGLPDVAELQQEVCDALPENQRKQFEAVIQVSDNFEHALSRLRRIQALLNGDDRVDGLTATEAAELDEAVCSAVVKAVRLERADLGPMIDFARWVVRSDYSRPIELFTVNYDLLLEAALEEERGLFFDGFVGIRRGRFHIDLVDDGRPESGPSIPSEFTRVWKLHGSVNWIWAGTKPNEVLRIGVPAESGKAAAIYPADTKYEESRRVPFVVLQDRFRRTLQEPESVVLIAGYSFSDEHLNEFIFDAAKRRPRSEFIAFFHSEIPEAVVSEAQLSSNLTLLGPTEAVRGGERALWEKPKSDIPGVWEKAAFSLGDFSKLSRHLAQSSPDDPDRSGEN